jgi:hypothetical protein
VLGSAGCHPGRPQTSDLTPPSGGKLVALGILVFVPYTAFAERELMLCAARLRAPPMHGVEQDRCGASGASDRDDVMVLVGAYATYRRRCASVMLGGPASDCAACPV